MEGDMVAFLVWNLSRAELHPGEDIRERFPFGFSPLTEDAPSAGGIDACFSLSLLTQNRPFPDHKQQAPTERIWTWNSPPDPTCPPTMESI